MVAAASPFNPRYSVVAFAGLSAEATRRCAQQGESGGMCEAVLMEAKKSVRNMLIAAPKPAPPIAGLGAPKKIASKAAR